MSIFVFIGQNLKFYFQYWKLRWFLYVSKFKYNTAIYFASVVLFIFNAKIEIVWFRCDFEFSFANMNLFVIDVGLLNRNFIIIIINDDERHQLSWDWNRTTYLSYLLIEIQYHPRFKHKIIFSFIFERH